MIPLIPQEFLSTDASSSMSFSGPKPTLLYSNRQWIQSLYLPLPNCEWDADMSRKCPVSIKYEVVS